MTVQVLVYPVLIVLVGGFALLTVPREDLRLLLPYGVVLGGLYDYIHGVITGDLLKSAPSEPAHLRRRRSLDPHPDRLDVYYGALPVLLAPKKQVYRLALLAVLGALGHGYSQVVRSAGLFTYLPWFYPIPMFLLFLIRFALATWVAHAPTFTVGCPPQFVHKWKEPHLILRSLTLKLLTS